VVLSDLDRMVTADRNFFARFPHRQHRLRLACLAEVAEYERQHGAAKVPSGHRMAIVVRNMVSGVRMRVYLYWPADTDTDIDEDYARAVFEDRKPGSGDGRP
jgi:hypothetical protein